MGKDERHKNELLEQARQREQQEMLNHPTLIERFGRPLLVGGTYTLDLRYLPVFTIESIEQELDPRYPPGLFKVLATSRMLFYVKHRVAMEEFTLIGMPEAIMPAPAVIMPEGEGAVDEPDLPTRSDDTPPQSAESNVVAGDFGQTSSSLDDEDTNHGILSDNNPMPNPTDQEPS